MRKLALSLVGMLLFILTVMAQKSERVIVNVVYKFVHVYNTKTPGAPFQADMILHIGPTNSKYYYAILENNNRPKGGNSVNELEINALPGPPASARTSGGAPIQVVATKLAKIYTPGIIDEALYQIPGDSKLVRQGNLGLTDYVIEDPLPVIEWTVQKEVKMLGKYSCQKATGSFSGRNYIAWFCTDFPLRYGPWKLSGLPGLILEAYDDKNQVSFLFKEITAPTDENIFIPRKKFSPISEETFNHAKKLFDMDPVAYVFAGNANSRVRIVYNDSAGVRITSNEDAEAAIKRDYKITINNPVELRQK